MVTDDLNYAACLCEGAVVGSGAWTASAFGTSVNRAPPRGGPLGSSETKYVRKLAYAPSIAATPQPANNENAGVTEAPCSRDQIGKPIDSTIASVPPSAAIAAMKRNDESRLRCRIYGESVSSRASTEPGKTRSRVF
jgi:hypothetical protein